LRAIAARAAMVALALAVTGCGGVGSLAERYRVQRTLWWAQRTEASARLARQKPDSTALLLLREGYLRVPAQARRPYVRGTTTAERAIGTETARLVGHAELQAARLAVEANRTDLALEEMANVAAMADEDSLIRREADFFRVGTLRQAGRYAEAIQVLKEMMTRYQPSAPKQLGEADPILAAPEGIVRMTRDMGDVEGAKRELAAAGDYYRALLRKPQPPALEAEILARLVSVELEQADWNSGARDLAALDTLVTSTPALAPLIPEVRYSQAKLIAARTKNMAQVAALLDKVAKDFPDSPYAARALLESGALLESMGRKSEAMARYRMAATRYSSDPVVGPAATYRQAMLSEQLGNWAEAKNLLESIPVKYPDTEAAVQAPVAIAQRYAREGNRAAAETALRRAIEVYQGLIQRDTASAYVPAYRWSIIRCYNTLGDWGQALSWTDEMVSHNMGNPFTAEALLEGARLANAHRLQDRARGYLEQFLANYPQSPLVPDVKRELLEHGGAAGTPPSKP
jgi:tetratricopeptide (TPR) repeat protein